MSAHLTVKGTGMSMQSEGKNAKGRNYDQATKDASSSAGSMGTGGTGDIGRMSGDAGNAQSGARTDDWLSSGSEQERQQGFRPTDPGALETGLEGIGKTGASKSGGDAGNRQSGSDGGSGGIGNRHRDWGHSDVGNAQSAPDEGNNKQ